MLRDGPGYPVSPKIAAVESLLLDPCPKEKGPREPRNPLSVFKLILNTSELPKQSPLKRCRSSRHAYTVVMYVSIHLCIHIPMYIQIIPHWILIHHSSDLHFSLSLSTIATASSRLGDIEAALGPGWAEPGDDSRKTPRVMVVDGPGGLILHNW